MIEPIATIEIVEVLDYYNGPLLFTAKANTGSFWLAAWYGPKGRTELYLAVPATEEIVQALKSQRLSLADAFLGKPGWLCSFDGATLGVCEPVLSVPRDSRRVCQSGRRGLFLFWQRCH